MTGHSFHLGPEERLQGIQRFEKKQNNIHCPTLEGLGVEWGDRSENGSLQSSERK